MIILQQNNQEHLMAEKMNEKKVRPLHNTRFSNILILQNLLYYYNDRIVLILYYISLAMGIDGFECTSLGLIIGDSI